MTPPDLTPQAKLVKSPKRMKGKGSRGGGPGSQSSNGGGAGANNSGNGNAPLQISFQGF